MKMRLLHPDLIGIRNDLIIGWGWLLLTVSLLSAEPQPKLEFLWGHQVLNLYTELIPAGPHQVTREFGWGGNYFWTAKLPVSGKFRALYKIPAYLILNVGKYVTAAVDYDYLYKQEGDSPFRGVSGDVRFSTRFHLLQTAKNKLTLNVCTKLPNAQDLYNVDKVKPEDWTGLTGPGTNLTDFFSSFLYTRSLYTTRSEKLELAYHLNAGMAFLSDPTVITWQDDVLIIGNALDVVLGPGLVRLEYDYGKGYLHYDKYRSVLLKLKYRVGRFIFNGKMGWGLTESTDDRQMGFLVGYGW